MITRVAWNGLALAGVALLGACASPVPTPAPPPPTPEVTTERAAPDTAMAAFEQAQTDRATHAEARGHWAAAALAWEVLTLVRPGDERAHSRLADVRQRIDTLAAERKAAAETAQRRGDLDVATQAYLEVLALDPSRRSVADALRQIERDRARRVLTSRFARPIAMRPEMPAADAAESSRSANSVREHATMLVRQGDLDGAIQMLRDSPQARNDASQRALLADLYVQKADMLKQRQPEAARAAVNAALALDRRHAGALALQLQLQPPARMPGR